MIGIGTDAFRKLFVSIEDMNGLQNLRQLPELLIVDVRAYQQGL